MLFAPNIVSNPEIISEIDGKYQIIYDQSITDFKFDNLNEAICMMSEKGWRCVNITVFYDKFRVMYALMEKS